MSLYSGVTLAVKVSAIDSVTKFAISEPTCTFNFYAPPKNPKMNPSDRTVDHSFPGLFDEAQQKYVAYVDTTGWAGGVWYYQAELSLVPYTSWEYAHFVLTE